MKRFMAFILSLSLILSGCSFNVNTQKETSESILYDTKGSEASSINVTNTVPNTIYTETQVPTIVDSIAIEGTSKEGLTSKDLSAKNTPPKFKGLDDPTLLSYVENTVYSDLIDELSSGNYYVESIEAIYLSEEYLRDLEYNSKENVFFGYSLSELDEQFSGRRYMFTLGDDGQTKVIELEEVYDDTYDTVLKNVAIGGGVILICVTVSVATATAAPAVSMIFAASATTATTFALQSGAISFVTASIARGYQTHDFDEAIKAGTLAASESFKWGAITGAVIGGAKEGIGLKKATKNGLTMNQAAVIQRESKWPLQAIQSIHSEAEYNIYKTANLTPVQLENGSWLFVREIDWNLTDDFGRSNIQRVASGLAPIDETGAPYELHHLGQKADGPLAILTKREHHSKENFNILHYADEGKNITNEAWNEQKKQVWNAMVKLSRGIK